MEIRYTLVTTSLGWLLLVATQRGVCMIAFGDTEIELEKRLADEFGGATLRKDDAGLAGWASLVCQHLDGKNPRLDLPLDVRGTDFQQRVWAALRQIPYGEVRTYAQLAAAIGQPKAVRAAARACATNPVVLIHPCHRIVRSDGGLGGYAYGIERKRELLRRESQKSG